MAGVKKTKIENVKIDNKPKCPRCLNAIDTNVIQVSIVDDDDISYGVITLCEECGSSPRIRDYRLDKIADFVSNDLIEPMVMFRFNMTTWDLCQKIESWIGSKRYCTGMVEVINSTDPAKSLSEFYSRSLAEAQGR